MCVDRKAGTYPKLVSHILLDCFGVASVLK